MTRQTTSRLLIVDDHPLILSGIQALLEGQADLDVIGTAQTAHAALEAVRLCRPDLVIADGTLPDMSGITLVRRIRETCPGILTLALTLHDEGPYIREFVKAGVNGFVLKRSAAEDLLHAVRAVLMAEPISIPPSCRRSARSFRTTRSRRTC